MPPKDQSRPGRGGPEKTFAVVNTSLPTAADIARGSAGDCCILCGKVGVDLPLNHGCQPNIDVAAYRAQPKSEVAL